MKLSSGASRGLGSSKKEVNKKEMSTFFFNTLPKNSRKTELNYQLPTTIRASLFAVRYSCPVNTK